ncbi:NitT/TauT family transport system permease protein [Ruegeria halocynthiae]|uniref:NitT/TauT family transport system permease protein n=1 Tax=Ruegeria halocynthiae TaxID=985054 RepID=A0A1H3EL47_9RHOB|nr:ABC transporter permease [Ruegeria halocynthiae]SDX78679.1 NitT/TauT family transport system permease protein [Ruegeria halocynthiae]
MFKSLFAFRKPLNRRTDLVLGITGFILFLTMWEITVRSGVIRPEFLPSPVAVVQAFVNLFVERNFASDIVISVSRVWFAFLLSVIIAIPLGLLMSTYRFAGAILEPFVDFVRYLPVPALVPLLVIWFGVGETSKIAVLWMGTFFQLILMISDDTKRVPVEFVESGQTLGASNGQIMRHIIIPAALPNMIDSLRITMGWCWTYLIVAEIVAANSGIGHVIWSLRRFVKTPEVMAGIITIGIIGLLTDQAFRYAHTRLFSYLRR